MKLICILLLAPFFAFSQDSVRCTVTNSLGTALPFTNIVSMQKNIGTITNEKGEFQINNINNTDSLKISNVAFIPKVLEVKDLRLGQKIILVDSIKKLENIVIVNFNKFKNSQIIGYLNYPENGEFRLGPGNQLATFISNELHKQCWIKGVYFKVKDFGKCVSSIRIRLVGMDTILFQPGLDVLNKNIILSTDVLKKKNYIDLRDYKLLLPIEGIFIVIEWLDADNVCTKNSYFSIGANLKIESNLVWLNFRDKHWSHPEMLGSPNGNFMTPNVALKIAY